MVEGPEGGPRRAGGEEQPGPPRRRGGEGGDAAVGAGRPPGAWGREGGGAGNIAVLKKFLAIRGVSAVPTANVNGAKPHQYVNLFDCCLRFRSEGKPTVGEWKKGVHQQPSDAWP